MNTPRSPLSRSIRVALLLAASLLLLLVPTIAAQDDANEAHPAHIHSGTCDQLGDVVYPLGDIAAPSGEEMGAGGGHLVKISEVNHVDVPLQEIIDGGHAINVHLSAEEIGTYIACGNIGGIVQERENGEGMEVVIGLAELNDSGHTGIAWLGAEGDQTRVAVHLVEPATMGEAGTEAAQEATPGTADGGADAAAESLAVEIKDFAFNPPEIAVPVGGSVTWTNQDNAPHTATGLDREALQSGAIAFSESFTQAFDTAGTYEYFCEFHPNMKGSIVVE